MIAIALDRLSQAYGPRKPAAGPRCRGAALAFARHRYLAVALGVLAATWIRSRWLPALDTYPESLEITTSAVWAELVKWININFFDAAGGGEDLASCFNLHGAGQALPAGTALAWGGGRAWDMPAISSAAGAFGDWSPRR